MGSVEALRGLTRTRSSSWRASRVPSIFVAKGQTHCSALVNYNHFAPNNEDVACKNFKAIIVENKRGVLFINGLPQPATHQHISLQM